MNIELKPWTMDDLHDLVRLCNAADRTYLSGRMPFPYTESDARWWLNMVKEKEGKDGVFRRICVEGKTAGNISVERKDDVFCHDAELGYVLDRPYWSKGIMREAVRMITGRGHGDAGAGPHQRPGVFAQYRFTPGAGAQRAFNRKGCCLRPCGKMA